MAAHTLVDAIRGVAPDGRGLEAAMEVAEFARHVHRLCHVQPDAARFFRFLAGCAARLDPGRFFKGRGFVEDANGFRWAAFSAQNMAQGYLVSLCPPDAEPDPGLGILTLVCGLGIQKTLRVPDRPRTFRGMVNARALTRTRSVRNVLALAQGLLRIADPDNIAALEASCGATPPWDLADLFRSSFPRLSSLLRPYIRLSCEHLIQAHTGVPVTRITVKGSFSSQAPNQEAAAAARRISQIKGLFRAEAALADTSGNALATLQIRAGQDFFSFTVFTREGKVVPVSQDKRPVPDKAFALPDLGDYDFSLHADARVSLKGLQVKLAGISARARYSPGPEKTRLRLVLAKAGPARITGRLLGFLPPWLLGLFVAGDMEKFLNDILGVLVKGNDGQGAWAALTWDTTVQDAHMLHVRASCEMMDSFLLKLGSRATQGATKRLAGFAAGKGSRIVSDILDALQSDVEALAAGNAPARENPLTEI